MSTSDWGTPVSFSTKTSYSNVNEQAKLLASNGVAGDRLGYSIAISSSGNTVAVGAYAADPLGYMQAGAVYIYGRNAGTWTQQGILIASDKATNDYFGYSVAMNSDGSLVIVGAVQKNTNRGAAYIFHNNFGTWTELQILQDPNGASNYYFGCSVSMSEDGAWIVIGSYADNTFANSSGSAIIFSYSGSNWVYSAKYGAQDSAASDLFGICVAINGLGNYFIVGAYLDDDAGTSSGSAYIFYRAGDNWFFQTKITASDAATDDNFGRCVSMNRDGNIAIVSAFMDDTTYNNVGSVYVFIRSGTTWSQQAKLTPNDPVLDHWFGGSCTINKDGTIILMSANGDDAKGTNAGAVYVFGKVAGIWTQQYKLTASDTATTDYFGYSVASNQDGTTLAIGTVYDDDKGTNAGAAYIFS